MNEHKYIITARYENYDNETIIRGFDHKLNIDEVLKIVREIWNDDGGYELNTTVYIVSIVHVWTETNGKLHAETLSDYDSSFEVGAGIK
jgi:hypothetical protein